MKSIITICFLFCIASFCSCSGLEARATPITFSVVNYGAVGNGRIDDSQAFLKAWNDVCGASLETPTLDIPVGKTFMLNPVRFQGPCNSKSVHVQVGGNIVAPQSTVAWEGTDKGNWLQFSYVNGLIIDGGGQIDGQGDVWWKACNNVNLNVDSSCQRPTALSFRACNGLQLSGLKHLNSQRNHISINGCNGAKISNLHIIAPDESPNTDGIDISSSSYIDIQNSLIETGDDCIAINSGSSYIKIAGIACGPGHGISIGSLGKGGAYEGVEHVLVQNCAFKGTQNGVRIKTWQGGSGYARNISFEHITMEGAKNPIIIDQYYFSNGQDANEKSAVNVSDVTYRQVLGYSANEKAIDLNCSNKIGCTNIVMDWVNITSSDPGKKTYASCNNAHGKSTVATPIVSCLSDSQ